MLESRMPGNDTSTGPIGGAYCLAKLDAGLIVGEGQFLTERERNALWRLFKEIGRCWNDVLNDSENLKSSWLEFIEARTTTSPSYVAEYSNAVLVIDELLEMYGEKEAFARLFLSSGIQPKDAPLTRLAHAKRY